VIRFSGAQANRPEQRELPVEGPQPNLRPVISPSSVGATLAITREKFGQELKQVAQALRIRLGYLEAIEEDRYAELPGLTYAVGFVRSYADYLGLDSKLLVVRYKNEAQGLNRRTQLVFPTPAAEAKVPTGAIILVALILIGLTYLGWTYFSDEAKPPPAVAEQPAAPAPAPTQPAPAPAPLAGGTTTDSSAQAPSAPAPAAAPAVAPAPAAEAVTPAAAAPAPVPLPAPDATAAIASEAQVESAAPASPAAAPALVGAPPAPPAPQPAASETTAAGQEQVAVAPPLPAAVEAAHRPRLVIRAEQDSWVQIRNAKDEAVLTQVLREGESYEVPEEPGLVLLTGNAGGLVLVLDGQPLPPLGPVGAVRRNIALDPDALAPQ